MTAAPNRPLDGTNGTRVLSEASSQENLKMISCGEILTKTLHQDISNFDNEMQKLKINENQQRRDQDLYGGLIRLHILHHASREPVFGLWFIEELGRHGYKLSPGTLYPLLHGLERKGYLRSTNERSGKSSRRMYQATPLGRKALAVARQKVSELFGELLEDD